MSDKVSHEEARNSIPTVSMWANPPAIARLHAYVNQQQASESASLPTTNAEGLRVVWEWAPWARFLAARAQLIHEATAAGKSAAEIRDWLSMDEVQVRLIAATDLDMIAGVPGAVWPPAKFQKKEPG